MSLMRFARSLRDTRGAEIVEFALVTPVLLVVLAGIVDMGFMFNSYEVITNAAREGARLAAVPGWTDTAVKTRVNAYIAAAGLNTNTVVTTVDPVAVNVGAGTINGVKVVVSYPYNYMMLGPMVKLVQSSASFDTITLTAASTMRTEIAAGL